MYYKLYCSTGFFYIIVKIGQHQYYLVIYCNAVLNFTLVNFKNKKCNIFSKESLYKIAAVMQLTTLS